MTKFEVNVDYTINICPIFIFHFFNANYTLDFNKKLICFRMRCRKYKKNYNFLPFRVKTTSKLKCETFYNYIGYDELTN